MEKQPEYQRDPQGQPHGQPHGQNWHQPPQAGPHASYAPPWGYPGPWGWGCGPAPGPPIPREGRDESGDEHAGDDQRSFGRNLPPYWGYGADHFAWGGPYAQPPYWSGHEAPHQGHHPFGYGYYPYPQYSMFGPWWSAWTHPFFRHFGPGSHRRPDWAYGQPAPAYGAHQGFGFPQRQPYGPGFGNPWFGYRGWPTWRSEYCPYAQCECGVAA